MNSQELFPIVDAEGKTIGSATRKECHSGSKLLHPVVHLHIITHDSEVYLQKRSEEKDIQPGKWDTAVGGHVDFGERVIDALLRETFEELGVNIDNPISLGSYIFESEIEKEFVNVFFILVNKDTFNPNPDPDEVADSRFWSFEEVLSNISMEVFTPNFESEFVKILPSLKSSL